MADNNHEHGKNIDRSKPMDIICTLIQLRNDLKTWVTNNLRVKLNKNLGAEESGKYLTVDVEGNITATELIVSHPVTSVNGKTGAVIGLEDVSNKVKSLSTSSTDSQYPSAKCIYDNYATKNYVSTEIAAAQLGGGDEGVDLSGYATKDYVDNAIAEAKTDASNKDAVVLAETQREINAIYDLIGDVNSVINSINTIIG